MSASVHPTLVPARPAAAAPSGVETIIKPKSGWIGVDWAELVSHRELLAFLVWRDVKVKYKQAIFGSAWAVVVPLVQVLIYSAVGILAGFASRTVAGVPYTVWMYAGLLPWLFIQTAINSGGLALVNNQQLLSKIYMPRLFIPAATIGGALVDMMLSWLVFFGMVLFFVAKTRGTYIPSWHIVFVPLLIVLAIVSALGTSFLLSALTVMFRDLRFIIPFITQLGIWLTAVVYPQTLFTIPARDANGQLMYDTAGQMILAHDFRNWLALNPFTGIVQSFRAAITGEPLQHLQLATAIGYAFVLFIFGIFYFKRVERSFADIA